MSEMSVRFHVCCLHVCAMNASLIVSLLCLSSVLNSVNLSFCLSANGKYLPDNLGEPTVHIWSR